MIRFDHVTKTYRGAHKPGLSDVDFEIKRGEFVFLVGASGSGKSTCLRLILREDIPSEGRVFVLGRDMRTLSNRKVPYFRRHVGAVFQDFRLLPSRNVFQNVAFTLQVTGASRGFIQQTVPEALELVGLAGKEKRLPHELSGGEQQRVAIARALVNRPQVLLADEPTGNLDPGTSIGIMQLLSRINAGGTTVVMATHEAGFVDQMQRRVIELDAGEVVRDESHGGYGDTSALPSLTPEKPRGAEAMAALTAVLELQQRVAGDVADDPAAIGEAVEVVEPIIAAAAAEAAAAAGLAAAEEAPLTATQEAPDVEVPADADAVPPPGAAAAAIANAVSAGAPTQVSSDEATTGETPASPGPDAAEPAATPVQLTGPIEVELPDLPDLGVADRLGLSDDDDRVGPTS